MTLLLSLGICCATNPFCDMSVGLMLRQQLDLLLPNSTYIMELLNVTSQ